jgi:ubiquinone biosynthesis protein
LPELDYDTIVSEVRGAVLAELDYVEEATTTANIARRFAGDTAVVVPVPHSYLSTGKVLTTGFIQGRKITDVLDELEARSETGDLQARRQLTDVLGQLMSGYLKQILLHGQFQADPHPGNLLVTDEGRVAILDFGCSKSLLPEVRESYLDLVRAFLTGDRARMGELFDRIGFRTRSGRHDTLHAFADVILTEFRKAMASGSFCWPDRESILEQATELLTALERDPVVVIPTEFVMIGRVLGTLMGLFTRYQPDIAFAEHVLPVLQGALFASGAPTVSAPTPGAAVASAG